MRSDATPARIVPLAIARFAPLATAKAEGSEEPAPPASTRHSLSPTTFTPFASALTATSHTAFVPASVYVRFASASERTPAAPS